MAGNPDLASLWTDADVYVGPLTAPNPATIDAPFGSEWGLVGLLDGDDGLPEKRDVDTDDKYAWGGILVRTSRAHFKLTKSFSALEDNPTTRSVIWPGSSATEIVVPKPVPVKVAFEVRDGDTGKKRRLITRRHAVVDVDGDIAENETDLTKVTLSGVIYPDGNGVLFDRQASDDVASLAVTPGPTTATVGGTRQLTATATLAGGDTQDVTATAMWSTSAPGIATVSAAGLVTGVAAGSATITAAYNGQSGTAVVTVS